METVNGLGFINTFPETVDVVQEDVNGEYTFILYSELTVLDARDITDKHFPSNIGLIPPSTLSVESIPNDPVDVLYVLIKLDV